MITVNVNAINIKGWDVGADEEVEKVRTFIYRNRPVSYLSKKNV